MRRGDRRVYADGTIGLPVEEDEIGKLVEQSGYFAIARRKVAHREKEEGK
jgi:hypothetical protein